MLETTDAGASTGLSEKWKRAMDVLGEVMILDCFFNEADFQDLEELHKSSTRDELA